jgi:5'-3' exonuclease
MGIEKFFNSIARNKTIRLADGITLGLETKIDSEYIYIDFNSIIYTIATEIETELNYLLYEVIISSGLGITDDYAKKVADLWGYMLSTADISSYKEYFTSELIDEYAIKRIKDYIINLIENILVSGSIKRIMIALDGVPTMSKMIEQKRRRYMGHVSSVLKRYIYAKHVGGGLLDDTRMTYEHNKISYDRGRIISWSSFMGRIRDLLTSDVLYGVLKEKCPNLNVYIVSQPDVPGEGEKKIMENIIDFAQSGNYLIFSPDADVIILSLIMCSKLHKKRALANFGVLRHNQQTQVFDYINCTTLIDNLYAYLIERYTQLGYDVEKLHLSIDDEITNKMKIINDISTLLTLFGNDFVPKIESIDVRSDFETIIDTYCALINSCMKDKTCNIVFEDGDESKISYINLMNFMWHLGKLENQLLNSTYMASTYKNFNYLKSILGSGITFINTVDYAYKTNDIFKAIRDGVKEGKTPEILSETIYKIHESNRQFMRSFVTIEGRINNVEDVNIDKKFKSTIYNMASMITPTADKPEPKSFYGRLRLDRYENSVASKYHTDNILKGMPSNKMPVTDFDRELYKLDKKLDEYSVFLNAIDDYNLGRVTIEGNTFWYKLSYDKSVDGRERYYSEFFSHSDDSNTPIDISTPSGKTELSKICEEYIKGLFWTFDFYFNKNDRETNYKRVSIWLYPYVKAPLITDIFKYMSDTYKADKHNFVEVMNSIYRNVTDTNKSTSQFVDRHDFMNKLEQYLYVTPKNKQIDVPKRYKAILSNPTLFPDLDLIAKGIIEEQRGKDLIDCRRTSFLNKCHLTTVKTITYEEFMKEVLPLRDPSEPMTPSFDNFVMKWSDMVGGNYDIVKLINKCKNRYIQTRDKRYKILYKKAKRILLTDGKL